MNFEQEIKQYADSLAEKKQRAQEAVKVFLDQSLGENNYKVNLTQGKLTEIEIVVPIPAFNTKHEFTLYSWFGSNNIFYITHNLEIAATQKVDPFKKTYGVWEMEMVPDYGELKYRMRDRSKNTVSSSLYSWIFSKIENELKV